ncbi:MAG: hypothetical protein WCD53_16430 [Microcoleus sp.]
MLTAALATKLIRQILVDYNNWPGSESDSSLKIARSKTLDDKILLARDASMRRTAEKTADPSVIGYKAPVRRITTATLDETFLPLVKQTGSECEEQFQLVKADTANITTLEPLIERVEFLVQLYSAFSQLEDVKVSYVIDGDMTSDPYTGFFITGTSSDGETVIAQTLLVQT